jgi:hypothetical protein
MIPIAVISYNDIFPYEKGVHSVKAKNIERQVLFLPNTFNPKCVDSVQISDSNFQLLVEHTQTLEKVIVFFGKKKSGACAMIPLFSKLFAHKKKCLVCIVCEHDLKKKLRLLAEEGITEDQIVIFSDAHMPCQETPQLLGYLYYYLNSLEKPS